MLYSHSHITRRLSLVARWTWLARSSSECSNRADVGSGKDWKMKLVNTITHQSAWRILALALIVFAFAWPVKANAEWTVIPLHPNGASRSWAIGVGDGGQVGFATVDGDDHASLWNGSANSWVDLNPTGADRSQARSVDGSQQIGTATVDGLWRASLWSGTATSWVDLTPYWAGATQSVGSGSGGGVQVGYAIVDGVQRASLWIDTAESWVDLHPSGATGSYIKDTDGVAQAGEASVGGSCRASLWYGSAASWVDLTPVGAWGSYATGVDGEQQVGYIWLGNPSNTTSRASLWSGTAESWVDLHPAGVGDISSCAYAVDGGQQVGFVGFHASLWSGTAESWVDLQEFLPKKFSSSNALGIWHDATYTYVVGFGYNSRRDRDEALMWVADNTPPPPPPGGEVTVDDIYPNTMNAGTMMDVTITGSGFQPGAAVTFMNGSGPAPAADVTYVSPDGFTIEATITAPGGGPPGTRVWDVRVTNPDDSTGMLTAGFTVIR